MYADRYAKPTGLNPGGMMFALGASGVLLFGLSLSAPNFIRHIDTVLKGVNIPLTPDPKPIEKPIPQPHAKTVEAVRRDPVDTTKQTVTVATGSATDVPIDLPPLTTVAVGTGTDIGTIIPLHVPVIARPQLDSRYIDNFQPNYPSDERLAGHAGRVIVRVLIGTDGRVKDVQQISAASAAFFEATRKQALNKWRFRPGTRDGVAVEAWHTMAVSFVLGDE